MACNLIKTICIVIALTVLNSCSRGALYDGEDYDFTYYMPDISTTPVSEVSYGLYGSYSSQVRLFFGSAVDYDDVMIFSPPFGYQQSADDSSEIGESTDKSMAVVNRYLIRRNTPHDLQSAILQPKNEFRPYKPTDCVLTLRGRLQKEDQCLGASKCKLYRVDNIYTGSDGERCGFPAINSFVVRFDGNLQTAEVVEPGAENLLSTVSINYFSTKSSAIRLSSEDDTFSSVIATTTANGYAFAGKRLKKEIFSASFPDEVGTTPIRIVDPVGVSTLPYFEKAQTRNVLLALTSNGIHKLNSQDKWELLPLPSSLPAMPRTVDKILPVSGVGIAAFRIIFTNADSEKNLVLVYREATNKVEVIDLLGLDLEQGSPSDAVPSGWELSIINEKLWFWHQLAPTLGKTFDEIEKKWNPVSFIPPVMPEAGSYPKHQLIPAGEGFVVSLAYNKKVQLQVFNDGEEIEFQKKAYRHFFYNAAGEATGVPISTFSAPESMHVLNGRAYFERVVGIDNVGAEKTMDYGYVYDFVKGTGKMFADRGFNDALGSKKERLAEYAGILVTDKSVLFYGGCENSDNILQCSPASPLARLVKFPSF